MLFLFARQPQTHPSEIEAKTRLNILRRRIVAALQNDDNARTCPTSHLSTQTLNFPPF